MPRRFRYTAAAMIRPLLFVALLATPFAALAAEHAHEEDPHGHAPPDPAAVKKVHKHLHDPNEKTAEQLEQAGATKGLTDEKLKKLAAFEAAALEGDPASAAKKSGLPAAEADKLSFLVEGHYEARRTALKNERALAELTQRIEAVRAEGKEPPAEDLRQEMLLQRRATEHKLYRGQFAKLHGDKVAALVDQHEKTFIALLDKADEMDARREKDALEVALKGRDEAKLLRFLSTLKGEPPKPGAQALTRQETAGLELVTSDFYLRWWAAQSEEKQLQGVRERIRKAREGGGQPTPFDERLERHHAENLSQYGAWRTEFTKARGEALTALLDKHADAFVKAFQEKAKRP